MLGRRGTLASCPGAAPAAGPKRPASGAAQEHTLSCLWAGGDKDRDSPVVAGADTSVVTPQS